MTEAFDDSESLVEMRIRYDVPDDAAGQIRDLADSTEDLRANLEAVSRFSRYQMDYYRDLLDISSSVIDFTNETSLKEESTASSLERQLQARSQIQETLKSEFEEAAPNTGPELSAAVLSSSSTLRTSPELVSLLNDIPNVDRVAPEGETGELSGDRLFPEVPEPLTPREVPEAEAVSTEVDRTPPEPPTVLVSREVPEGEPLGLLPDRDFPESFEVPLTPRVVEDDLPGLGVIEDSELGRAIDSLPEPESPERIIPEGVTGDEDEFDRNPSPSLATEETLESIRVQVERLVSDNIERLRSEGALPEYVQRAASEGSSGSLETDREVIPGQGELFNVNEVPGQGELLTPEGQLIPRPFPTVEAPPETLSARDVPESSSSIPEAFFTRDVPEWDVPGQGELFDPSSVVVPGQGELLDENLRRIIPEGETPSVGRAEPTTVELPTARDYEAVTEEVPRTERVAPTPPEDGQSSSGRESPTEDTAGRPRDGGDRSESSRPSPSLGERFEGYAGRISSDASNTSRVINATTVGDALQGAEGLLSSQGLLGAAADSRGLLGGVGGAALRAVPYIGGAYLAYQGVSNLAESAAETTSLGRMGSGGFQEGLQYRAAIQQMALNPFLTTEQSRQIVLSALNEGYTGKEFDTMTDFMATNLADMNMSVSDSVKLLQGNVEESGQSVESLSMQLKTMNSSISGATSGQDLLQEQFVKLTQQGVQLGMSGAASGQFGMIGANMFQDKGPNGEREVLAGTGADILSGLANSQAAQSRLASEHGIKPWEVADKLSAEGTYESELMGLLEEDVKKGRNGEDPYIFSQYLQSAYGIRLDPHQAKSLQEKLKEGGIVEEAQARIDKTAETEEYDGPMDAFNSKKDDYQERFEGRLNLANDQLRREISTPFVYMFGGGSKGVDELWAGFDEKEKQQDNLESAFDSNLMGLKAFSGKNDALRNLVKQYGTSNLILEEGDKRTRLDEVDFSDEKALKRVTEGRLVIQEDGKDVSSGTLKELARSGGTTGGEGAYTGGTGTIGLTPEASKLVTLMENQKPTQNTVQSWSGWGGARLNDPPEGDR